MTDTQAATSAPTEDLAVAGPMIRVRLLDLPLDLLDRAQQASEELLREFTLIAAGLARGADRPDPGRRLPARLISIVQTLLEGYRPFTVAQDEQLAAAVRAGMPRLDQVVYEVPASAADAARALGEMLDEADDYCRAGEHLLTLATPPDLVAFRRWFLGEFERQAAGDPPMPGTAYLARNGGD
jgi:hypothetical protein